MRILRAVFALALALVLFTTSAAAQQQPVPGKDVAKRLFDEGVELEKQLDYPRALAKYHEAEQITITAGLHFHVAFCLERMNKLAGALDAYEAALKLAHDTNKPEVEKAIVARLEPLRTRVPFLAVHLTTPAKDVEVEVDGVSLAPVLLDGKAFHIDPGEHTVAARASGYAPFSKKVQATISATTNVDIALDAESPPVPGTPRDDGRAPNSTDPPVEPPSRRSRVVPIVLGVGAIAFLGAGIGFFVAAGNTASDARTACLAKVSCNTAQKQVRTQDALALTGFIGAGGLGALTVLTWTWSSHSARASAAATRTAVVATPTSLGLEGSF